MRYLRVRLANAGVLGVAAVLATGCDNPGRPDTNGTTPQPRANIKVASSKQHSPREHNPIADEVLVSDPPVDLTELSAPQQTQILSLLKRDRDQTQIEVARKRAAEVRRINRLVIQACEVIGGNDKEKWLANYKRGNGLPVHVSLEVDRHLKLLNTADLPSWLIEEILTGFDPSSPTVVELDQQELDQFRRYKSLAEELFAKLDPHRAAAWRAEFQDTFKLPTEVTKRLQEEIFKLESDTRRDKDEHIPEIILLYHRIQEVMR